ncbi:HET-domain-containing protein [Setomelanomma holmii]|uniref:HET-domain-containing protein n=1 Tax=Setomelanomma holmii TaxID=210430 RepID=A0A9P4HH38_9PLEO|nr:HET-domain-containing protein [Setomelanomma holmii]
MRLIDTETLEIKEVLDSDVPPYIILSHTWGDAEVTFPDMESGREAAKAKAGYAKIVNLCRLAKARDYQYVWMDSCCIDKRSSAELSEAINSMFRYYSDAEECLIYLSDVPAGGQDARSRAQQLDKLRTSRWFTRGWTLQELIAPKKRSWLSTDWKQIASQGDMVDTIAGITKVHARLLRNRSQLSTFCTAERMSWASARQTTRSEDLAYSLMGLFSIHIPVLYGEGAKRAFRRLQEEILRSSFDQSIFVWRGSYQTSGLLARSPADFANTPRLALWAPVHIGSSMMTNVGLTVRMNLTRIEDDDESWLPDDVRNDDLAQYFAIPGCDVWNGTAWLLVVFLVGRVPRASFYVDGQIDFAYRRVKCDTWMAVPAWHLPGRTGPELFKHVLVLEDEHFDLVSRAIVEDDEKAYTAGRTAR